MKYIAIVYSLVFSTIMSAQSDCDKVVPGYEASDSMYVICDNLSSLDQLQSSDLIIRLFNQYKGPPDEVAIFFVQSQELVGKHNFSGKELTGFYYTHSNKLEIFPYVKDKKKEVEIIWK